MDVLTLLLIFAIAVAAGLTVLFVEHLRWERENRPTVCTTCGRFHARRDCHR